MPVPPGTYNYVVGPYEWDTTKYPDMPHWRGPVGLIDAIDLRALSSQGIAGGPPEGVGFFVLDPSAPIPAGSVLLQNDLGSPMSSAARAEVAAMLGVSANDLDLPTLLDSGWAVLTDLADPAATNRCKPLMPTVQGNMELHLAKHSIVRSVRFDRTQHAFVRDVIQDNAVMIRDTYAEPDRWRKYLGSVEAKYGWLADQIIPGAVALKPETTITESFNTADSDTLGPDLTWAEDSGDWDVLSNQAASPTAGDNVARAVSSLSSDDHSTQFDWIQGPNTTAKFLGVGARKIASGTLTYYLGLWRYINNDSEVWRRVTGAHTQLGADLDSARAEPTASIKISANGSTIELFIDGVSEGTRTDTNITGNLQTAMIAGDDNCIVDNFEAGDLAGGWSGNVGGVANASIGEVASVPLATVGKINSLFRLPRRAECL